MLNQRPKISVEQFTTLIEAATDRMQGDGPIETIRRAALEHLRGLVAKHGFDLSQDQKRACCLMPFIFQELNYDGLRWSNRTAFLGPLEGIVELDVILWSAGVRRSDLTDAEYKQYWKSCLDAIDFRQSGGQ